MIINNYLSHYGIKGQRWGVRRYETSGGKLTPAGKKRYVEDLKVGKAAAKGLEAAGTKGQRWGVRRYETSGGKLTPAGEKRYAEDLKVGKAVAKGLEAASKLGTQKHKSKVIKKDYSDISDDELRSRVNRLNMEQQYGRLTGDTKNVRSGSDYVRETLQNAAIAATIVTSAVSVYISLKGKLG